VIVDADVATEDVVAPAVVISRDPQDRHAAFREIGQGCQRAKAVSRNDRLPFEPEVKKIAIDDQRTSPSLEPAEK